MHLVHEPRGRRLAKTVFNSAQLTLSAAGSGLVYVVFKGPVGTLSTHNFPLVLVSVSAAALVYFLLNVLFVGVMISFVRGLPLRDILHANYSSIIWSTFSFAFVGLLLGGLYEVVGLWAPLFVLVPLLVARRVIQTAVRMDQAYESTLKALVTAIEAKDAYTRGHAERVSKLTTMIARELRFTEKEIHNIRIAALMHQAPQ